MIDPKVPDELLQMAFYPQSPTCQIATCYHLLSTFLGERSFGCFVEVGAHDGWSASNTWGLATRGYRGLMIEPVSSLASACRANHARHPLISVIETAVGAPGTQTVEIHLAGLLTTANKKLYVEYGTISWASNFLTADVSHVPCVALDSLLMEYEIPTGFDLLVVDVEGFEAEVFLGFDLDYWLPKMLIIELADTHPSIQTTRDVDARLSRRILEAGYSVVWKDATNTVFVQDACWSSAYKFVD